MATDPHFGTKIRKRRQELGLTQAELAERISVDRTTVANWERGRHFPLRYQGAIESALSINLSQPDPREASQDELDAAIASTRQTLDRLIAMRDGETGSDANGDEPRAS
jgi:transcriptional regulator with XRE-family HTH domain